MKPLLTIGMATYDDFHGVYFSIQALRLEYEYLKEYIQLLVVDNNPSSAHGKDVQNVVANARIGGWNAEYVAMPENTGTSASRNRVFSEAEGQYVLCMDCHVLFPPGTIGELIDFLRAKEETTPHLYHGPLMFDSLKSFATHFNDQWRAEMWGTWGHIYHDEDTDRFFSMYQDNDFGYPVSLIDGKSRLKIKGIPQPIPWVRHEDYLDEQGFRSLNRNMEDFIDRQIDIPGQGLGMFLCSKEHWQWFNRDARGFGGEELYIHMKHRKAGYRVILLPWFQWLHRFGRPDGVKYPLTRWNKVRNYVLEFKELGIPLTPIFEHFVLSNMMSQQEWEYLVADPVQHLRHPNDPEVKQGCGSCGSAKAMASTYQNFKTTKALLEHISSQDRDLNEHMATLFRYAEKVSSVVEVSNRRESLLAFQASKVKYLQSYNSEARDPAVARMAALNDAELTEKVSHILSPIGMFNANMPDAELYFFDFTTEGEELLRVLESYHSRGAFRRFVAVHDTQLFNEVSPSGELGHFAALRRFMQAHPEFSVVFHDPKQHGLTILSRDKKDKPELPKMPTQMKNFVTAMASFVKSGMEMVDKPEYMGRLAICATCDKRVDGRCSECGCFIEAKAKLADQNCPINKWPAHIPQEG